MLFHFSLSICELYNLRYVTKLGFILKLILSFNWFFLKIENLIIILLLILKYCYISFLREGLRNDTAKQIVVNSSSILILKYFKVQ